MYNVHVSHFKQKYQIIVSLYYTKKTARLPNLLLIFSKSDKLQETLFGLFGFYNPFLHLKQYKEHKHLLYEHTTQYYDKTI